MINKIIQGDSLKILKTMPDQFVNCCVTSPPYWGLRDYGIEGQLGLEKTPEEYINKMVEIFLEIFRVLRDDGTLWLNLGDSYCNPSRPGGGDPTIKKRNIGNSKYRSNMPVNLKPKDMTGIPWMVAFALRANGWYLRSDIIWHKPNPMPESVTDRPTKAHEYIFLMSKSQKYYYDAEAIKEQLTDTSIVRLNQAIENRVGSDRVPGKTNGNMKAVGKKQFDKSQSGGGTNIDGHSGDYKPDGTLFNYALTRKRNKRSVWTITTHPFKQAHFATFPPDLIRPCIIAGCPGGGIVLDPFMGAGTTALVSLQENRNFLGIELNQKYIKIAENRIKNLLEQGKLF